MPTDDGATTIEVDGGKEGQVRIVEVAMYGFGPSAGAVLAESAPTSSR